MKSIIVMTDSAKVGTVGVDVELNVDIQYALQESSLEASDPEEPPSPQSLTKWAQTAYKSSNNLANQPAEVTIRIVADVEMRDLNNQYRGQDKITNVLSFPFQNEFAEVADMAQGLLGDVVICHSVVVRQAKQEIKTVHDHYAHLVTHGILHLCGYDHQQDKQAEQMEALEAKILALSNISNPYTTNSELN